MVWTRYVGAAAGDASSESDGELRVHKRTGMGRFAEWLGHWKPEYDDMDQNELMLQVLWCSCRGSAASMIACRPNNIMPMRIWLFAHCHLSALGQVTYNIERSQKIGNEPIVAALRALDKFEVAVGGDSRVGGYAARPASPGPDAALITSSMGTGFIESQPAPDGQLEVASPVSPDLVASQGTPNGRLVPRGSPGDADALEEVINHRVRTQHRQSEGDCCISAGCVR